MPLQTSGLPISLSCIGSAFIPGVNEGFTDVLLYSCTMNVYVGSLSAGVTEVLMCNASMDFLLGSPLQDQIEAMDLSVLPGEDRSQVTSTL